MNTIINNLSLKEKLLQMFILGFEGTSFQENNALFQSTLKNGLGGVIFFAENIETRKDFINLVSTIKQSYKIQPFLSIDQEGGLVERTIKLDKNVNYLTPMALAQSNNINFIENHTQIMSEDLIELGINMNFAPTLDVNTNPQNPVIGIRSFSSKTNEVIKFSEPVYQTFSKNNIIPCGKHFPGHGEAFVDSHIDMPQLNMDFNTLDEIHIKPFKKAIKNGIEAIMIAHVHYKTFNKDKIPASLSKNVINYLKNELNFKGLIISDDMVMGGVSKHYGTLESIIKGIEAGIDTFIFKDTTKEIINCIEQVEKLVLKGVIKEERIEESVQKILKLKNLKCSDKSISVNNFDTIKAQKKIDKIALNTIKVIKKGNLIPLNEPSKTIILSPDKSKIFNLSFDKKTLGSILGIEEIIYPLNPDKNDLDKISKKIQSYKNVIFINYNATFNTGQLELFNKIKQQAISISTGLPYDTDHFKKADTIIQTCCYKEPSLKAIKKVLL